MSILQENKTKAATTNIETFYRVFRDIATLVHSSTSLKEVLDLVVHKSTEIMNAKGALLRIHNEESNQFDAAAAYGFGEKYFSKGPVTSEKILTEEIRQNRVLIIKDIWKAPRVEYPQEALDEGIRMILDVPLTVGTHIVGVIRIYLTEERDFSDDELSFVVSIAEQCACAINKTRLLENQKSRYEHLSIQTEKMSALGRLAAGIAHEINNPLAGILLFSSRLSKKVPKDSPVKEGLDVIVRETVRCKSIIQELLEFSRDKKPQKTPANLNDIIEKALSILENEFHLHHINIEKNLSDDIEETLLDENQIEQVLVNLLLNAVNAIQEKGAITIKSWMDPKRKRTLMEIADTGCGISPEHLPKIFDPFFSTKNKGTGLGLAVSYGIVKNHEGDIRVFSKPGEGTRFILEFPILTPAPEP
jgi:two-component system NtrC family sensor kinase